jgi:hypothetical protein
MTNNIVNVNVYQTIAPTPPTLQQVGALLSQGGTTLAAQTRTILTQASDLTPLLVTPQAITSLAWSGGTVTVTTTPHGLTTSSVYYLTVSGAVPTGYNGTYACTVTGTSTFTYAVVSNPGSSTTPGTWAPGSRAELIQMVTTFFAQGSQQAVYVIELGTTTVAAGVTALTTWLAANVLQVYSYLVPRSWDGSSAFISFLASYQSTTAKQYFYVTTTNATFSSYTVLQKSVFALIEAPTVAPGGTEFTLAGVWWYTLFRAKPSATNRVAPLSFVEVNGVTVYPATGSSALFAAWKAAGVNYIDTASEGGIQKNILKWGTTMDLRPWNYWFAVDWTQLNIDTNVSAAVINGSQSGINPLYDNQAGINTLEAVIYNTLTQGVTYGLIFANNVRQLEYDGPTFATLFGSGIYNGDAVVNAIPFAVYYGSSNNPSDYKVGVYNGFAINFTPLQGFASVTININVSDYAAP